MSNEYPNRTEVVPPQEALHVTDTEPEQTQHKFDSRYTEFAPRMVRLDEVRIHEGNVVAAPLWSYRLATFTASDGRVCEMPWFEGIPEIWADIEPIVLALKKKYPPAWQSHVGHVFMQHARHQTCVECGRRFFGENRTKTCTNKCQSARAYKQRKYQRDRRRISKKRGCISCGGVFTPTRKDARFCSVRCRVANHRINHSQPLE